METKVIVEAMWVLITARLVRNKALKHTKLYANPGIFYKNVVNAVFGQTPWSTHNYLSIQALRTV